MQTIRNRPRRRQPLEDLAGEVLSDLYAALTGDSPRALRAYRDEDALLLLLRFDPASPAETDGGEVDDSFAESAFMAMLEMVAEVVSARSGCKVAAGNLGLCASRGMAVFAFSVLGEGVNAYGRHGPAARTRFGNLDGGLRLAG